MTAAAVLTILCLRLFGGRTIRKAEPQKEAAISIDAKSVLLGVSRGQLICGRGLNAFLEENDVSLFFPISRGFCLCSNRT